MVKQFFQLAKETQTQAKWWTWAAWTLPFVALAIISFENYIGWDSLMHRTLVIISVVFFTISVYWWWWALNKIVALVDGFNRAQQNFEDIKDELRKTREVLNNRDVGDR